MWLIPRSQNDFRYIIRRHVFTKSRFMTFRTVIKEWNVWCGDIFDEGLGNHIACRYWTLKLCLHDQVVYRSKNHLRCMPALSICFLFMFHFWEFKMSILIFLHINIPLESWVNEIIEQVLPSHELQQLVFFCSILYMPTHFFPV